MSGRLLVTVRVEHPDRPDRGVYVTEAIGWAGRSSRADTDAAVQESVRDSAEALVSMHDLCRIGRDR